MLKRHTEEQQHAEAAQEEAVSRATASLSSKCAGLQRLVDDKVEQVLQPKPQALDTTGAGAGAPA